MTFIPMMKFYLYFIHFLTNNSIVQYKDVFARRRTPLFPAFCDKKILFREKESLLDCATLLHLLPFVLTSTNKCTNAQIVQLNLALDYLFNAWLFSVKSEQKRYPVHWLHWKATVALPEIKVFVSLGNPTGCTCSSFASLYLAGIFKHIQLIIIIL